jgi:hypothetical protein
MRDPSSSIAALVAGDRGGLAVVYYPDYGLRDWIVSEVETIASAQEDPVRVNNVDQALDHPGRLVLLLPSIEQAVVEELDARREHFLEPPDRRPVVLFLLRGGDGAQALAKAPALASWVRGHDPDPELLAEVDVEAERCAFARKNGSTPEEWLARWRGDALPKDPPTLALAYHAMLLEKR